MMPSRAATVFLGAFLLFQLQPIVAKAILPQFGGAPAVWTTCMLFFQSLLLAGYAYAHASTRALPPRIQGALHLVLVAIALLWLPIESDATSATGSPSPVAHILAVLARSVALPYFVLCASTPLLQAWTALDRGSSSPYRLYALSNAVDARPVELSNRDRAVAHDLRPGARVVGRLRRLRATEHNERAQPVALVHARD